MNLKLLAVASVTFSFALAAGCVVQQPQTLTGGGEGGVGGVGPGSGPGLPTSSGPGGPSAARQFYISDVHTLLVGTSDPAHGCTTCHATGASNAPIFMDTAADPSYDKMDKYSGLIVGPADSQLLLHGLHTGPAMSQTQKDTVTHWLTMEAQERGLPGGTSSSTSSGGGTTMTLAEWLIQVGKCMDNADWKTSNLELLSKAQTFNAGPCGGCHSAGEGGEYLDTLDPTQTFTMQTQSPYVKRWFKPKYTGGIVTGLEPNPRQYMKGQELQQSPCTQMPGGPICHPSYILDPTLKTGVDNFINLTLTRMANKACPP